MSAENLRRIADDFTSRVADLKHVPDPMGLLSDLTMELARNNAEFVFFKTQTEPGWTAETAQALADRFIHDHIIAIADVLHANGGTVDMAQDLAQVAATAYGTRLAELSVGHGQGGVA